MLQSASTISQSIPDHLAQFSTFGILRGKTLDSTPRNKSSLTLLFEDLYHMCNDPRLAETNDRLHQLNDSLQKDYQSAVAVPEHRHLLTVSDFVLVFLFRYIHPHFSGLRVLVQ